MIRDAVQRILSEKKMPDIQYIATDSISEIIEKLIIINIRIWMLEDAIQEAKTDAEIADLKRKIDISSKIKRPKFIEAINLMIDDCIRNKNKSLVEGSVKLYRGVDNETEA
jgi:hypothetical protein